MDPLQCFREMQVKIQIPSSPFLVAGLLSMPSELGDAILAHSRILCAKPIAQRGNNLLLSTTQRGWSCNDPTSKMRKLRHKKVM